MKQLFILTISTILILLSLLIYSGIYEHRPFSRDELEKKYAKPPSKFLNLPDGTRIHYRDEGSSNRIPILVLLHEFCCTEQMDHYSTLKN